MITLLKNPLDKHFQSDGSYNEIILFTTYPVLIIEGKHLTGSSTSIMELIKDIDSDPNIICGCINNYNSSEFIGLTICNIIAEYNGTYTLSYLKFMKEYNEINWSFNNYYQWSLICGSQYYNSTSERDEIILYVK